MKYSEKEKYALVKRYYDGEPAAAICTEKRDCKKHILLLAKTVQNHIY